MPALGAHMLEANPPLSRFKYVVKQYGDKHPDAVFETFYALSDTVGIERPDLEFDSMAWWRRMRDQIVRGGDAPSRKGYRDMLDVLVGDLEEDPRMQRGRDSDALWPWLARELVKVKKSAGASPMLLWGREAHGKGSAIALWQKTNRIDLGQWRLPDVLEALATFEVESDATIPQGEVVYEFDDGWTVQRLMTPEQLEAEGEVMQHCVGEYCEAVARGNAVIYSLRDPQGRPHATMELGPWLNRWIQVRGKQNEEPKPEYQRRVDEFSRAQGILPEGLTDKEARAAFQAGYDFAEELWNHESSSPHFAGAETVEEAPDLPNIEQAIEDAPEFAAHPNEYWEAGLVDDIEERMREGADAAWDGLRQDYIEQLGEVVNDVLDAAQDEVDQGTDPQEVDLDYLVEEAMGRSFFSSWGDRDYVNRRVEEEWV